MLPPTLPVGVAAPHPKPATVPVVPGYELLDELGQGGMGVVYRARQLGLNRLVALKMMLGSKLDDRLRFLAEAEAVAAIAHPNVVPVHEFGTTPVTPEAPFGHPYMAMEYVPGGSLARLLARNGPVAPRDAAALVEQIARGVQAVHDVGIVHRDLKPANILLAVEDSRPKVESAGSSPPPLTNLQAAVPKVSDFGIAKRGGGPDLTQTGVALGTPTYMSPEQARGESRFIGPATDVHALGVILFECLTGRPPYLGETPDSVMFRVIRAEPPSLRALRPDVPRDLDLICRKCLAKKPGERYTAAADLADDLKRYLAGEPVTVRPPGALEHAAKWVRRHPLRAAAYGLTALAAGLSALALGIGVLWWRADEARAAAEEQRAQAIEARDDAHGARRQAEAEKSRAEQAQDEAERQRAAAEGQRAAAEGARGEAEGARKELRYVSAVRAVDLALREYEMDNPARARWLLDTCPEPLRAWEWRYVDRLVARQFRVLKAPGRPVWSAAVTPDGKWLAAGGLGYPLQLWNLETGAGHATRVLAATVTATPDGRFAVVTTSQTFVVLTPGSDAIAEPVPANGQGHTFHPGGKHLLVLRPGGRAPDYNVEAVLRDADNKKTFHRFQWPNDSAQVARFSPTGERVAVGGLHTHREIVQGKDGVPERRLGAVRVYDTASGIEVAANTAATAGDIIALAWSADGKRVAAGDTTGRVVVFDARTLVSVQGMHAERAVWSLGFSADGARLVGACDDRTARVWDVAAGREVDVLRGHSLGVRAARFLPDGSVLTGSEDGSVRFWRVAETPPEVALGAPHSVPVRVAVSADGRYVATADRAPSVLVRDTRTGQVVASAKLGAEVCHLGFANEGTVVLVDSTGAAGEWVWAKGTPGAPAAPGARLTNVVAVGPDRVVQAGFKGAARVRDRATGAPVCALAEHPAVPDVAAASADGRFVATGGWDGSARLWDARTGRELRAFPGHTTPLTGVAFSPDGERLATVGQEGWLKVWDTATGFEVLTVRGDANAAPVVGWSADGAKLVTASGFKVRILDAGPPAK